MNSEAPDVIQAENARLKKQIEILTKGLEIYAEETQWWSYSGYRCRNVFQPTPVTDYNYDPETYNGSRWAKQALEQARGIK